MDTGRRSWDEVKPSPLGTSATIWPIVPAPNDGYIIIIIIIIVKQLCDENWQGKSKYSEKPYPSATLSTRNPTWTHLGSNPGRRQLSVWAMARPMYLQVH
jgi:hypothetical protein